MEKKDKLIIFDTTLRDGEQSPGASMNSDEKMRIAKALEQMRVDVIEAGFPIASPDDFRAVKNIAGALRDSRVCALARALDKDITCAGEALASAKAGRIHTFIATSPIHMKTKLKMKPDEVLAQAVYAVKLARKYTDDVEFSPEDAGRSDMDFLCRVIEAVIDAGASTVNIPDTVGYNVPMQFGRLIRQLIERIPNATKAVFSVHCHNDLGLAVANSLAAVQNGARQAECTINGLGERAGNAALEEIVMTVKTRSDIFNCYTDIDTRYIVPVSRLVSGITGFPVQPNKAVVGANAFAHESGIHQDGVLKHRENYEIMRAEDVGWSRNRLVLGKHSGRNALRARLQELNIDMDGDALNEVFVRFKALADKKQDIHDEDLQSLISTVTEQQTKYKYALLGMEVASQTGKAPCARVQMDIDGEEREASMGGGGAVDATFRAIEALADSKSDLLLYSVNNITTGTDAQGEVTVRLSRNGHTVNGVGADTDIVIASAKAYVNALNRLDVDATARTHPQQGV